LNSKRTDLFAFSKKQSEMNFFTQLLKKVSTISGIAILLLSFNVVKGQNVAGFGYTSFSSINAGTWTYGIGSNPFTVTYSGDVWDRQQRLATYAPVSIPAALSNYVQPTNMLELGAFVNGAPSIALFTFTSPLPAGTVMFIQDVDALESFTFEFLDAADAVLTPGSIGTYNLSNPARSAVTFNPANLTVTALDNVNYGESLSDFVITSNLVKKVRITQIAGRDDLAASGTAEFYFATAPVLCTISGNVWNDVNGNAINNSENPIISGVWVNLVDPVTHDVIQSVQVDASGNYSFTGLAQNTNYQIILTNTNQTGNLNLTTATLPTGYQATGTNLSGVANTTNNTGLITVNTGTSNLTAQNFGIQQPPTAVSNVLPIQINPGGTTSVPVPANYFDGNDQGGGTVVSIVIGSFPTNATSITINGVLYTAATFPVGGVTIPTNINGNPLQTISVDPISGNNSVVISYRAIDNAGAFSMPATVTVPFNFSLPLKLISFSGMARSSDIMLKWVTASEQNVAWHIIQKSSDGVNYVDIYKVAARNLITDTYTALDVHPYLCKNYYRLKSVDMDGSYSVSNIILVQYNCDKVSVIVYPNPVSNQLNISGLNAGDLVQLYSADGTLLVTRKVTASTQQLDISRFAPGMYEVKVFNNAEKIVSTKIIKY
jgi:Secretion system C-terminal sorting domain/SdrD B-like domain